MVDRGPSGSIIEVFLFRVFGLSESLFKVVKTLNSFSVYVKEISPVYGTCVCMAPVCGTCVWHPYVKEVPPLYGIREEGCVVRLCSGVW